MLINFSDDQRQKFQAVIKKVQQSPEVYLTFETVSDVYHASWLKELPPMCKWYIAGLDDGAEDFVISICFTDTQIVLTCYSS